MRAIATTYGSCVSHFTFKEGLGAGVCLIPKTIDALFEIAAKLEAAKKAEYDFAIVISIQYDMDSGE